MTSLQENGISSVHETLRPRNRLRKQIWSTMASARQSARDLTTVTVLDDKGGSHKETAVVIEYPVDNPQYALLLDDERVGVLVAPAIDAPPFEPMLAVYRPFRPTEFLDLFFASPSNDASRLIDVLDKMRF